MRLVCSLFIILTFTCASSSVFRNIYVQFDRERLNENIVRADYNLSCQQTQCFIYSLALPPKIIERMEHRTELVWLCFVSIHILIKCVHRKMTEKQKRQKRALEIVMNNNVSKVLC